MSERNEDLPQYSLINRSKVTNVPIIYADGMGPMVKLNIIKVTAAGNLFAGHHVWWGITPYFASYKAFPCSEHNLEILRQHTERRAEGLNIVHEADQMKNLLEPFPPAFWVDTP